MKTFSIQTLGCKVNHYEGEQLAGVLRARGLVPAGPGEGADLRVVHTCSVTVQAASKSRQTVRRAVRLPVLSVQAEPSANRSGGRRGRVIVTGCWATSDAEAAASLPGVDAVLTHRHDVAAELDRLLAHWVKEDSENTRESPVPKPAADDGWMMEAGASAGELTRNNKSKSGHTVKENPVSGTPLAPRHPLLTTFSLPQAEGAAKRSPGSTGMPTLPILGQHQTGRQRATLKVQDGCDAHCTYCIIPSLRPALWSKPLDDAVQEARALVAAGHVEIVLTGIFLGAYGHATALRRRQVQPARHPLGELVVALCTRVPGLRRVRLSSLEPGDLSDELIEVLRDHPQVVPHFHLPVQSGSHRLLRRMNRQYTRDDFLSMLERVNGAFDRPALTTDVIVGFPGESDEEFAHTADLVERARFIHVHAFSFSPRPWTAAARWRGDFVHGPVVNERIEQLHRIAADNSYAFRQSFVGETVEVLIEAISDLSPSPGTPGEGRGEGLRAFDQEDPHPTPLPEYREREIPTRHGRCERYFGVTVSGEGLRTGDLVRAKITRVTSDATYGEVLR